MMDEMPHLMYVEKGKKYLYSNIDVFKHEEKDLKAKDQFIFAMAVGFKHNKRIPLKSKEWFFRTESLKEDEILIDILALATTEDPEILTDKKEVFKIAQEYANGGIKYLNDELESIPFGSFDKRLEKDLRVIYRDIMAEIKSDEENKKSKSPIDKYIGQGETSKIEFKSSMRWDVKENKVNKSLSKVITKSIAGFLNNKGGTLLIGVEDNGNIYGIEKDVNSLGRKDNDGFQQYLMQIIENDLGTYSTTLVDVNFDQKDSKQVCIVKIKHSKNPIFMKDGNDEIFYIRSGNTTRPIKGEELIKYINDNFN